MSFKRQDAVHITVTTSDLWPHPTEMELINVRKANQLYSDIQRDMLWWSYKSNITTDGESYTSPPQHPSTPIPLGAALAATLQASWITAMSGKPLRWYSPAPPETSVEWGSSLTNSPSLLRKLLLFSWRWVPESESGLCSLQVHLLVGGSALSNDWSGRGDITWQRGHLQQRQEWWLGYGSI